VYMIKWNCS